MAAYDELIGLRKPADDKRYFGVQSPLPYESPYCSSLYEDFLFYFQAMKIGKALNTSFQDWMKQEYYIIVRQMNTISRASFIENERTMWVSKMGTLEGYPFDTEYTREHSVEIELKKREP